MKSLKTNLFCPIAVVISLFVYFGEPALAQTAAGSAEDPTIRALLDEVRLLRQTLQRTGLNAYRSQIIVERMRAINERVIRLTRTHEDLRNEIDEIEPTLSRFGEMLKQSENQMNQEADPASRKAMEMDMKERKQSMEVLRQRLDRLREREIQTVNQLRAEQARLGELENRLDALEREIETELEKQRLEDAAKEPGKPKRM